MGEKEDLLYCERFIEFLVDLESQLPTRRYVNSLVVDLNLIPAIKLSPLFNDDENGLLRDLFNLLRHFVYFPVDDHSAVQHSRVQSYEIHCSKLAALQRVALKHFKSKLMILALSNYASIDQRAELEGHLLALDDQELVELCAHLGFRTAYPKLTRVVVDRSLLVEIVVGGHERRKTFQEVTRELSVLPTEVPILSKLLSLYFRAIWLTTSKASLFEPTLLRNETYNGSRPLAIPKLNLQYLSVGDFLWRSFILHRCESFFEIRKDVEEVVKRVQPRSAQPDGSTVFEGFSKMALPISKPAYGQSAFDQLFALANGP